MKSPIQHPLIKAAEEELASLLKEQMEIDARKSEIDQKVAFVGRTVETLRKVYGQPGTTHVFGDFLVGLDPNLGVTDQVREVLRVHYPTFLTPTAVRDQLEARGTFLKEKGYDNPMALIHQILRRLETRNEVTSGPTDDGGKAYQFKTALGGWALKPGMSERIAEQYAGQIDGGRYKRKKRDEL